MKIVIKSGINVFTTSTFIFVHLKTYQDEEGLQQSISDFKGYPYYYNDELEVYDWNGNFLRNYQTIIPFYDFFVTEDHKTLFTISQDLNTYEPIMVKYELQ